MASRRRRLLFVTDVFPFPLDRGQRVRVKHLLAACGRAFDVTFLGPAPPPGAELDAVAQHCERTVYLRDAPDRWTKRISTVGLALRAGGALQPLSYWRNLSFVG